MRLPSPYLLALLLSASGALQAQTLAANAAQAGRQGGYLPLESTRELPSPLARPVTLHAARMPLERVIESIASQAGLGISYGEELERSRTRVSVDLTGASAADALRAAVRGTGWQVLFTPAGQITVTRAPWRPGAVAATITGRVVDGATERPLAGATLLVVGTSRGAVTDASGGYSIEGVPPGAHRVRATLIGYGAQERSVALADGQSATVDFSLQPAAVALEGVVAVGYGTRSSRDVTGSVAAVSPERLETLPVASVDQALAGQVSGVQVLQTNGVPGGGPQIQIRGVGAIGAGNQPLYVVDGFPLPTSGDGSKNPLTDISPQDIASITVLKDASSAAIYGSRAANGVVVITTKTGRNQAPKIQVDYSVGVQQIPERGRPDMMDAREFAQYQRERIEDQVRYSQKREPTAADIPAEYRDPSQYGAGTNWFDLVTRTAPMQDLNVSVTGGTANIGAFVSAGYRRQEGVVAGTDFDRYTLRANVNATITPRLKLGLNVAPTFSRRNLPVEGDVGRGAGTGRALVASPLVGPHLDDGTLRPMIEGPGLISIPNPLLSVVEIDDVTRSLRGIGTAFAELELRDGLRLRSSANVDVADSRLRRFTPSTVGVEGGPPPRIPVANYNSASYVNWLAENTANYTRGFGADHKLDLLAGMSVQVNNSESGNFRGTNFPDDDIRTLNAATEITGGSDLQDWGLVSYLARVNYDFAGRYLLSAAIRRDGSSRFAPGNRWGTFPSASVGWRLSQEPFLQDAAWLDDLKLRASWGRTGNNNIGNYSYIGAVGSADYVLANSLASGRVLDTLGNEDLGWEQTEEINLGLDVALFGNRLTLTAEAYQGDTKDLLLNVEVPQSSGFSTVSRNTGSVRNRGIELALHSVNLERGRVQWSSDVNVAVNRNKVLALDASGAAIRSFGTGAGPSGTPTNITMVGQPVGMFYGYIFEGLYRDEDDIETSGAFPGAIPGNIKFRDINGDGTITPIADSDIIGNPYPDATFGLTNSLVVGRFDLSVIAAGQIGGDRLQTIRNHTDNLDGVFNVSRRMLNRWRSPENPGDGETPTPTGVPRGRQLYRSASTLWVEDATHLSVRNVTLRYKLPDGLLGQRFGNGSVYLSVQNALMLTRYPGNPEVTGYNSNTTALTPGIDYAPYPVPRTLTVGTRFGI